VIDPDKANDKNENQDEELHSSKEIVQQDAPLS
jgi:hypothetical protein